MSSGQWKQFPTDTDAGVMFEILLRFFCTFVEHVVPIELLHDAEIFSIQMEKGCAMKGLLG